MPDTAVLSETRPGRVESDGGAMPWGVVAIAGAAQFMASLDNLVVTMALPVIRRHLHAGLGGLEWTVNAYTLTFAVLLLPGAALGDRFGRRRMFVAGLALFTAASAASALSPNISLLVAARALQGAGGALVVPLSLTLLSAAVPAEKKDLALGLWGALGGAAVAVGPLVGGAVVQGLSWQFIFWLNVPIGVALAFAGRRALAESHGANRPLDRPGIALASLGLLGVVYGLVKGGELGWTSGQVLAAFVIGAVALVGFIATERTSAAPMLDLSLFARRDFGVVNAVSVFMSFGMFGSIFLLAQFMQTVQHYSPVAAGLRTLPWTGMPVLVAPLAGLLVPRLGGRVLISAGLGLQAVGLAWMAFVLSVHASYLSIVPAFICSGVGMSLFFVPVASVVLASVRPEEEGVASGTNNALRELGGVFGIAVLGAVFSAYGSYRSGAAFTAGLLPAVRVGAVVVAFGSLLTLALPRRISVVAAATREEEPVALGAPVGLPRSGR